MQRGARTWVHEKERKKKIENEIMAKIFPEELIWRGLQLYQKARAVCSRAQLWPISSLSSRVSLLFKLREGFALPAQVLSLYILIGLVVCSSLWFENCPYAALG